MWRIKHCQLCVYISAYNRKLKCFTTILYFAFSPLCCGVLSEMKVLKVYIEFSLDQPKGGLHFVVPDIEGSMAEKGAHVFSCGYQNSTR